MPSYSIEFSEPLRLGFEVPDGKYNGPGGIASTSLRLHGRGAVEWGEGVNEDLVRLVENFASASPPPHPVTGQMWAELKLYRKGPTAWFRYNIATLVWENITAFVGDTTGKPTDAVTAGTYRYDSATGKLWGYYEVSTVGAKTYDWRERAITVTTSDALPLPTVKPEQTIKVYNAFATTDAHLWVPPQSVTVSNAVAPTDPVPGSLWFDTSTGNLNVWDNSTWQSIRTGAVANSDLNMSTYGISFAHMWLNEGNGDVSVAPDVRFGESGLISSDDNLYVNIDGNNSGTGAFTVSKGAHSTTGSTSLLSVFATGEVRAETVNYETLVQNDNTLVNKKYVTNAIAAGTSGLSTSAVVFENPTGTFSYKAGDIAISNGKIYIALYAGPSSLPGGGWRQVWPATYS